MSLQLVLGNSGSGKSRTVYEKIVEDSLQYPQKEFLIMVPEQFTMETQKIMAELHPGGGILNIDVLSFQRLAYRVFEQVGGDDRKLLEETGKSLVLQKVVQECGERLPYLGSQMKKQGYLDEVKSLISEFMQYDVSPEEVGRLSHKSEGRALLAHKLADVQVLYQGFRDFLKEHYMTGEEVLDVLCQVIEEAPMVRGSVVVLDGFTGFTPIQNRLVAALLKLCEKVYVTVTLDEREDPYHMGSPYSLFAMSKKMIGKLLHLAEESGCEVEETLVVHAGENSRFAGNPAMKFLEQNLFRFRKAVYEKPQEEIVLGACANPREELQETARKILYLVREEGLRYGEIAVVTGDLAAYSSMARQVFEAVDIPCFIDEKHSVLMNPFVEYIRSCLEMTARNYSYESVFRYLRCGMSSLEREDIDKLENYVIALGIRGKKQWKETWTRLYRGMKPEEIQELNSIRKQFVEETSLLMEEFSGRGRTVEAYTRALYQFIVQGNIQQKLHEQECIFHDRGNLAMEKEYAQIYGIVMSLLDKLVEILGEEKVTRAQYQQLMETGLSQAKVALIPPSADQVLVGDMERTRLKGVKVLFLVGVNEGNIPKNVGSGGILTEMDREFLEEQGTELAPGSRELTAQQRFYLYLNMTKPSHRLFLSYSLSNAKGEPLSPAYLISTVRKLFPHLELEAVGQKEEGLEFLQHPQNSLDYFLKGLKEHGEETDPLWRELYTWYRKHSPYKEIVERLVKAAFTENPGDRITASVARVLYGEISPYGATRLERYSACAFAHFLRYGLELQERAEYEFKAVDMGNVVHKALERFAGNLQRDGRNWENLNAEERDAYVEECLEAVTADYGNTILHSSARNEYLISRVGQILKRTVWALQEQLKRGQFVPEGFEVTLEGGRIDRVDVHEEEDKVFVKVMDYKTGNTSFSLIALYHGLQLQLMVYLNGAMEAEKVRHPGKEIIPAGIFYYQVKDPMVEAQIQEDVSQVEQKILKELRMNGLVQQEEDAARKMDRTLESLPVSVNKDGSFRKGSKVADKERFRMLSAFVKKKIGEIQEAILSGDTAVSPYRMGQENACAYCPYHSVCGFEQKLPGYEFRNLKRFSDEELWELMKEEV